MLAAAGEDEKSSGEAGRIVLFVTVIDSAGTQHVTPSPKSTFIRISTKSPILQPKNMFDLQEGISDQKGRKSLPEVEKFQLLCDFIFGGFEKTAFSPDLPLLELREMDTRL
jgi:hypothetical protein